MRTESWTPHEIFSVSIKYFESLTDESWKVTVGDKTLLTWVSVYEVYDVLLCPALIMLYHMSVCRSHGVSSYGPTPTSGDSVTRSHQISNEIWDATADHRSGHCPLPALHWQSIISKLRQGEVFAASGVISVNTQTLLINKCCLFPSHCHSLHFSYFINFLVEVRGGGGTREIWSK